MAAERPEVPVQDPHAELERAFIDEYLRGRGCDSRTLHELPAAQEQALRKEAAVYAAARLAELEARAAYLHEIHHGSERT